jgi:hypothetical protein
LWNQVSVKININIYWDDLASLPHLTRPCWGAELCKTLLWEPNECLPALAQSEFCCCVSLDFVVGMLILLKQGWLDFDLKRWEREFMICWAWWKAMALDLQFPL